MQVVQFCVSRRAIFIQPRHRVVHLDHRLEFLTVDHAPCMPARPDRFGVVTLRQAVVGRREALGVVIRKSSRRRKRSESDVFQEPSGRRRRTLVPSSVGVDLVSRLVGRMDISASLGL